jgi:DNA polymerase-3 subunit alpha
LVREFPQQKIQADQGEVHRGMSVRIALQRQAPIGQVNAQLQLGDEARFFPSDAALASWTALAGLGKAQIVYD